MGRLLSLLFTVVLALALAPAALGAVLRVGSYHGIAGQYKSIQAAVNAAKPGDWILIGPGDYKTTSSRAPKGRSDRPAGVLITTPHIYLRGMNRNTVIVDGTKSGRPAAGRRGAQNFGPKSKGGPLGLNGILVYKANDVWVRTSPPATSSPARASGPATRSGGTAETTGARSAATATTART